MTTKSLLSPNFSINSHREHYEDRLQKLEYGDVLIVNLPNRFGKTVTALKYYENQLINVLYLSDRHEQMNEITKGEKYRQWYGLSKICEMKDDPFISALINQGFHANVLCRNFCKKESCAYKKQFKVPEYIIVAAPKEYLPTTYVQKNRWDVVILDENIEKAKKIQYTYPDIPIDTFEYYGADHDLYQDIGSFIEGTNNTDINLDIHDVLTRAGNISGIINRIKMRDNSFKPTNEEVNLLNYLNNLNGTIEWIQYSQKYGRLEHYYKPYIHYAYDLQRECQTKMILLNTSYDEWIYKQLMSRYTYETPNPQYFNNIPITNKNSILLHYNYHNRSLSKNTITNNKGNKFGGKYGKEIYEMLKRTVSFANKKELKTGVITFNSLKEEVKELFGDNMHIISHYGGHQGSNKFDDVDVLILIGAYHLNSNGLYLKHYIINNEYLEYDPAKWGRKK